MDIQDCIVHDSPVGNGIQVIPTGEATVTGTTIRCCEVGLMVTGKAMIGKGCSSTACAQSGVYAWRHQRRASSGR